ncbi:MAG: hypothetical protein GXO77_02720 [Calditrichaeota bacterium]|nr:hypothetical protein [Calditrichota bacterium]
MFRILWVTLLSFALFAGEKQPFSIDALYKIKNVSDPQISPDGKRIVFVVTSYKLKEGTSDSDLYLMNSDGSGLKQLTFNPAADYHPRWSADGKKILFVSARQDGNQAWLLPADGGEARRLTDFPMGVQNPEWVGKKEQIVFSSRVFPECGADADCNKEIEEGMSKGPLQAHLADQLMYRHWTFYKDGKRAHLILFDLNKKEYKDITPGDFDAPPLWGGFSVSANGRYVCVESKRDSFPASSTNNDLLLIDLEDGSIRNLTKNNPAYDGQPVFSPDSRFIAYQMQKVPGFESDLKRLAVYDLEKEQTYVLSESLNNWTDSYQWSGNSRFIFFRAHEKGHFPLYRVSLKNKKPEKIVDVKTISAYAVDPKGKWGVFSRTAINEPSELVRVSLKGNFRRRLNG